MSTFVQPKKWHLFILVAMVACLIFVVIRNHTWPKKIVTVKNIDLTVLVADTFARQHEGWSGKTDMGGADGMLFVFGFNSSHAMVMRDMQFPLDMVWVSGGVIVDMAAGVQPEPGVAEADLISHQSRVPSVAVLELKAGLISQLGLVIGDKVVVKD